MTKGRGLLSDFGKKAKDLLSKDHCSDQKFVIPSNITANDLSSNNIILNHDFSDELKFWHPNSCHGYVVSPESSYNGGVISQSGSHYVVLSNRSESWQGIEQDDSTRVSPLSTYDFWAFYKGSMSAPNGKLQRDRSSSNNIILNHDFSDGLKFWHPNSCHGYVVSPESGYNGGVISQSGSHHVVLSNRSESWQGIEQDVTTRVSPLSTYDFWAWVRVQGAGEARVQATLRLENPGSSPEFLYIGSTNASADKWIKVKGTFSLERVPTRVVLYLEGPEPHVDLLIDRVWLQTLADSSPCQNEYGGRNNIVLNHDFSEGLKFWHPNSCHGYVLSPESGYNGGVISQFGSHYVVLSNRSGSWQGIEQDVTTRVSPLSTYDFWAWVRVQGAGEARVQATLRLENPGSSPEFLYIGSTNASADNWIKVKGTFSLERVPARVVLYLEGPEPHVDLLIDHVWLQTSADSSPCQNEYEEAKGVTDDGDGNIILNPRFEDGLNNWSARGCKILLYDSMGDGKVLPLSGKAFASATERTQNWNGIQQEITGHVQRKFAYEVSTVVRIFGNSSSSEVRATLWIQTSNQREQYIGVANAQVTDKEWTLLQGKFLLNSVVSRAVIYLEGPPGGTDILVNNFIVKHATLPTPTLPPLIENPVYGNNIIQNSNLVDGLNGWFPLGACTLSSPHFLPPMARESLGVCEPLSGTYIHVTNRSQTWMGPAQMITDKVKLFLTYQVSSWVRVGSIANGAQIVNVAVDVDGQWINGGQVEVNEDRWFEIGGSFRIEKQPAKIMVYIQGPTSGVDLMVAGLHIFPVDRQSRFEYLKNQTDKVRKCDIILKFASSSMGDGAVGSHVKVKQIQNPFPFGTCISRSNIDNEDFLDFFVKNFNWAVFGNELKWYWTEPQKGSLNYEDADELLELCRSHNINVRGHCIFWEVESSVQQWVQSLSEDDLRLAVQNRLTGLLSRYKEKFRHYDVNNEMLHGSFYQDRLGKDIRAYMFKTAHQLDPSAKLFVNDYHIEDGDDSRSSHEKYIQQILDLQEQGAPIHGIGVQGHIDNPIGPIICSALDKLGVLGIPIWITELDVSSTNEYVRADDLEVMLRECYAHPAVGGIVLWGFWELFMCRNDAYLVGAEGDIAEAWRRYLALKEEWLSHAHGHIDAQSEFRFIGFPGSYSLEIFHGQKKVTQTFVVEKVESPSEIVINL